MDTSTIIAVLSVFIAGLALFFTIWQGWQIRKHNRLSVRPLLVQSSVFHTSRGKFISYEFKVVNRGIGPAIIKKVTLSFNGKKIKNHHAEWLELFGTKLKGFADLQIGFVGIGEVMMAGEEKITWAFKNIETESFMNLINGVDLIIEYQSMYGDKTFMFDTQKKVQ